MIYQGYIRELDVQRIVIGLLLLLYILGYTNLIMTWDGIINPIKHGLF